MFSLLRGLEDVFFNAQNIPTAAAPPTHARSGEGQILSQNRLCNYTRQLNILRK